MIQAAKTNYILVFVLVLFTLFLFVDGTITGNVVLHDVGEEENNEESPFYYAWDHDLYLVELSPEHFARYYPEAKKWQETDIIVYDGNAYSFYGELGPVIKISKNDLPQHSFYDGYIKVLDSEGKEYYFIK